MIRPRQAVLRPALALALAVAASSSAAEPTKEQAVFFESKIRPILADNCYKCHSIEQSKSKGGMTLDTHAGMLKGGEDGAILVPGDPDKSMMIRAISYTDPDLQMPPKGEKLNDEDIAALTQWVKMGAPDPRTGKPIYSKLSGLTEKARAHWAYQPVQKPAVPKVKNKAWPATPVDNFILAKLEEHNLLPSPTATKETLIRRAYYDLIGLPPTAKEVQAFVADPSPNAFEKIVDHLLASPHYGERWGRYWLDTARYADTIGGDTKVRDQSYRYTDAWTYRDYVIDAFNKDKPYDQFITEQIAADKLPDIDKDKTRLAALGFLTVGERFQNPNDIINDRIDVVSKGFLATTVSCARCHDHMFDPVPTKDYYALHGVFASTVEPAERPIIRASDPLRFADFQQKLSVLENENRDTYYRLLADRLSDFHAKAADYLKVAQDNPRNNGDAIKKRAEIFKKAGLDPQLAQSIVRRLRPNDPVFGPYKLFVNLQPEEFSQRAGALAADIAANKRPRRPVNPLVAAAFKDATPASLEEVGEIYGKLFASIQPRSNAFISKMAKSNAAPGQQNATAHAQPTAMTASQPQGMEMQNDMAMQMTANAQPASTAASAVPGFDNDLAQLIQAPFEVEPAGNLATANLQAIVARWPPQMVQRAKFVFQKINELEITHPGAPARAMIVADADHPHNSPVFIRGQAQVKGEMVPRHFLSVLSPGGKPEPFKDGSGRMELARCIAARDNPLTARVMVNRIWMHHFGEGFVRTPDDLGNQSEPPSHPELLDYLAVRFMDGGWSVKKLHRVIMLSKVYQESAHTIQDYERTDPENRLLWRANIRRLDFESIRDSLLALSGRLDQTIGGKPVNITDEPYSYRRSVYGYIDRGNLPELMANFDFSDPDMPNSRRNSTIVPQQALFLMNSPMSVDVARRIVTRAELAAARNDTERLVALYRIILQRVPKPAEIQIGLQFIAGEQANQLAQSATANTQPPPKDDARIKQKPLQKAGVNNPRRPIQNEGRMVEIKPLTPWETFTQALLLSNEASYVD